MKIKLYNKTGIFFLLASVIPWSFWLIAAHFSYKTVGNVNWTLISSIVAFIGLLSPIGVSAFFAYRNKSLRTDIKGRFFNFRKIKPKYLLFTGFFMLASILLAQLVSLLFGYSITQFQIAKSFSFSSGVFPAWVMLIVAPFLEELAWHTYGIDSLRSRFNLFTTSVIFALYWGIWHLPLSFIKDYYHSNLIAEGFIYSLNFFLSLFPFVFIINWLYYKTERNIILSIIFHITAGFFNEIFATHPMSKVIQTFILLVFCVFLVNIERKMFFSKAIFFIYPTSRKISNWAVKGVILFALLSAGKLYSQSLTQNIYGKVIDNTTLEPLPFSTIQIIDNDISRTAVADINGNFTLKDVPLGRFDIRIDMLGYQSYLVNELQVRSGIPLELTIPMQQSNADLQEIIVKASKETAINPMSIISARQFTVEETQRYAGGLDDPARLVSAFAGVASPSVSSSGISVRGNNPDGLLWRIEGVQVPNPNHFADLTIAGGGLLTAISSQMMGNSDFLTGAFPAEYGNVTSGVFDIKLKSGIRNERHFSLQAGLLGVDVGAQGPIIKGQDATFNLNYRYSSMALISPLLPDNTGVLRYQDLSFKTEFNAKKAGKFSFWGIGAIDGVDMEAINSALWVSDEDRDNSQTSLNMFAVGLSNVMNLNTSTYLKTTIASTGNGTTHKEQRLDYSLVSNEQSMADNQYYRLIFQSFISKRFGTGHSNRTGMSYQQLYYRLHVRQSLSEGELPQELANENGRSGLLQIYTQSKINLKSNLTLNLGINGEYFLLNHDWSIEPRLALKFDLSSRHSVSMAYGIFSRIEPLSVYFAESDGLQPNTDLKLMKSAHYVFSYSYKLNEHMHLTIEPYYQRLTSIPVSPDSYISTVNNNNTLYFNEALCSKGYGQNIGIDVTFERYLYDGFYYLLTGSLFDSKYTAADGIERNTRFNRNYVFNLSAGKEWALGSAKNNILGVNFRVNYLGGNRKEGIDIEASELSKSVVYGEVDGNRAFSDKFDDNILVSFTIQYKKNKPRYSSVWSVQVLNANKSKEFDYDYYNLKTGDINTEFKQVMVPNISYKIEF